ncbi:MAG: sigma-54 dependent transcriptional regulator [Acidobacteriota bacterium]
MTSKRGGEPGAPLVLVVDDEVTFRELYGQVLEEAGFSTCQAGSAEEALESLESSRPAMVISDVRMPGIGGLDLLREVRRRWPMMPFLLVTAFSEVREAVEALRLGAVEYLSKPVDLDSLVATVRESLGIEETGADPEPLTHALGDLVAESPEIRSILRDALRVARSDATVLLTGESGTGKDELAHFIHRHSERGGGPFVAVNCGAIPADLLPGALFGHRKGAFTGATEKRPGHFQKAEGGTLFLDEIGELPIELQPVLLRALETRRITPLGGDSEVQSDVRIIAATNRQLEAAVESGQFRSDLFYRLNVIAFALPPLAERPADIMPLARSLLSRGSHGARRLSPAAAACIESHKWPGNVRELSNAITRAALLARSEVILPEHLPPAVSAGSSPLDDAEATAAGPAPDAPAGRLPTLEESERTLIRRALAETDGNRTRAAEILGLSRRGLLNKIKRYGIG